MRFTADRADKSMDFVFLNSSRLSADSTEERNLEQDEDEEAAHKANSSFQLPQPSSQLRLTLNSAPF